MVNIILPIIGLLLVIAIAKSIRLYYKTKQELTIRREEIDRLRRRMKQQEERRKRGYF